MAKSSNATTRPREGGEPRADALQQQHSFAPHLPQLPPPSFFREAEAGSCEYEMNISFSLTLSPPRTNCFFRFARSHSRVLVSLVRVGPELLLRLVRVGAELLLRPPGKELHLAPLLVSESDWATRRQLS